MGWLLGRSFVTWKRTLDGTATGPDVPAAIADFPPKRVFKV